jgi:hypothetical protein
MSAAAPIARLEAVVRGGIERVERIADPQKRAALYDQVRAALRALAIRFGSRR